MTTQTAAEFTTTLQLAVVSPEALTPTEWTTLMDCADADLPRLVGAAHRRCEAHLGDSVTMVVNANLPGELFTDPAGAARFAREAEAAGATEICVQGTAATIGGNPERDLHLAEAIKSAAPSLHLHAFRPADILAGALRTNADVRSYLIALRSAGVDSIPGTGVKILDENYRARFNPEDLDTDKWIDVVETAHRLGLRSTSVIHYGWSEDSALRVEHLMRLREIQDRTHGFTELVPMPSATAPISLSSRVYAVARLMLDASIAHIQAAWPRLGPEGARTVLLGGADDLGGTLLGGAPVLEFTSAASLAAGIGRRLRQRTTTYGFPP